jgi:predicted PhzF superfamily epimerase YddE/YHI9
VLGTSQDTITSICFSKNIRDYVVGLTDEHVLESLNPNFEAMRSMAEKGKYKHEGLMVSAQSDDPVWDLKVRVFLPITGVNEDIACGSGNCSIIPFWYNRGLNSHDPSYRSVFPYPPHPEKLGGIQFVRYDPEQNNVTIAAEATVIGSQTYPYAVKTEKAITQQPHVKANPKP